MDRLQHIPGPCHRESRAVSAPVQGIHGRARRAHEHVDLDSMRARHPATAAPGWLVLPRKEHPLGMLFFGQEGQPLPFSPARFYFVQGIPRDALRGGHAHRETHEAVFCITGAGTLMLFDRNGRELRFRLEDPARGAHVPPGWWVELAGYTEGAMTLMAASRPFDESDYIRKAEEFFHDSPYPDPVSRPRP